jgi:hypothetical protein
MTNSRFLAVCNQHVVGSNPTAGSIQLHRMRAVSLDIGGDQLFRLCLSLSLACEVKKIQNVAT